jgi:hypothetical protein
MIFVKLLELRPPTSSSKTLPSWGPCPLRFLFLELCPTGFLITNYLPIHGFDHGGLDLHGSPLSFIPSGPSHTGALLQGLPSSRGIFSLACLRFFGHPWTSTISDYIIRPQKDLVRPPRCFATQRIRLLSGHPRQCPQNLLQAKIIQPLELSFPGTFPQDACFFAAWQPAIITQEIFHLFPPL